MSAVANNMDRGERATRSGNERLNAAGLFALLSGVFAASIALPLPGADGTIGHLPSVCPFYQATGLPCPGCGLTRAFVCISHGRLQESLHWHPLGWLVYAIFVVLWAYYALFAASGRRPITLKPLTIKRLTVAALTLLMTTGFLRIAYILTTHHNPF